MGVRLKSSLNYLKAIVITVMLHHQIKLMRITLKRKLLKSGALKLGLFTMDWIE
jgi:hypothetical protein